LKELLLANKGDLLGKLLGRLQKGFMYCPVLTYVAVSDTGMIDRNDMVVGLYKADDVVKAVTSKLDDLKNKSSLLSPKFWLSTDVGWCMKLEEAKIVAEFLVNQHEPISKVIPPKKSESIPFAKAASELKRVELTPTIGATCPKCGLANLVSKSIMRADGTETNFLACQNYPVTCKALFPLVAVASQVILANEAHVVSTTTTAIVDEESCPKCGTGKKVRRKGKPGKPDFFACSNYGKTKCRFQESIT
jgi:ssDNA-binding Zn-finger/Zn-ribbon topoisomerase 1